MASVALLVKTEYFEAIKRGEKTEEYAIILYDNSTITNMKANMENKITINGVDYVPASQVQTIIPQKSSPVGHYCIIRSRDSGVWAGIVASKRGRDATVTNARRLWWWKAKRGISLSSVALYGLSNGKLPAAVPVVYLTETCEFIPCGKEIQSAIENWKEAASE